MVKEGARYVSKKDERQDQNRNVMLMIINKKSKISDAKPAHPGLQLSLERVPLRMCLLFVPATCAHSRSPTWLRYLPVRRATWPAVIGSDLSLICDRVLLARQLHNINR